MRSHRNEHGHILMVVPKDTIRPFRNALQKLAGGLDFFALEPAERDSVDQALRHLWNPGDDDQGRDKTVPIDVLALAMRDQPDVTTDIEAARPPVPPSALARLSTRDRMAAAGEDSRPTVELHRSQLPEPTAARTIERGETAVPVERNPARGSDGYRAPSKGRHTDVSR
jgi:hypothetical protein